MHEEIKPQGCLPYYLLALTEARKPSKCPTPDRARHIIVHPDSEQLLLTSLPNWGAYWRNVFFVVKGGSAARQLPASKTQLTLIL